MPTLSRVVAKPVIFLGKQSKHAYLIRTMGTERGRAVFALTEALNSATIVNESAGYASKKLPVTLTQRSFTPAFDQIKSFVIKAELDGVLYPKEQLKMLVKYLEKRGVHVYGTDRSPCFRGVRNGPCQIYLPENPTILQVKHELSHWLDFKKLGFDEYKKLSPYQREKLVLERLQGNRLWDGLNEREKEFSINYVNKIREGYLPGAYYE